MTDPLVGLAGTTAMTWVALTTVKLVAAMPLNATAVVLIKLVPVMVTLVPSAPKAGMSDVIVGTGKDELDDVAVQPGVVTEIVLILVLGTTAVIWVALTTVKLVAAMLLNLTAVAPVRLVPVIVTTVPAPPDDGVNVVIVGAT